MDPSVFSQLLSERDSSGQIPLSPYSKWRGSHWVLVQLADLDYPSGNPTLKPLADQVLNWLLSHEHRDKLLLVKGKYRLHASQEGNALFALSKLGLTDSRCELLVDRLLTCQWPDGGWNCDRHPLAHTSSFHESLIPLRGLTAYYQLHPSSQLKTAIDQAAEVFLSRHLYLRRSTGTVIHPSFTQLHYPSYWHYDILFSLKVMSEAGFLLDPRCQPALQLLLTKRLPDSGFPAEAAYYNRHSSVVNWGGISKLRSNPFVTRDALKVLQTLSPAH